MNKVLAFLFCSLLVLAVGCTSTVKREGTHPPIDVPGEDTGVRWNSASIVDDIIADKIAVEDISSERTPTQTLKVNVLLMNRTDYDQQVECRTHFFDGRRVPCEKPTAWTRVFLSPNSVESYETSSMKTDEVSFFYVEIREGR